MDIDALSTEQQEEAMKKGLCFGCGKQRHIGKNCPDKKKPTSVPKKMNRKELYAYIWSLTAEMDEEEKEKLEEAEKEGF